MQWAEIVDWTDWLPALQIAGRIALILIVAWIMVAMSQRLIRAFRLYMSKRAPTEEDVKRLETLGRAFRYAAAVVISLVAGTLVLSELGISIAPILGAAGVVGIAVGFGAQSLIKDYFTGFFLLLEDQVHQGDVVEVGGKGGQVEEVTLRYIRLRDYEGNVHFVPNNLISTVTNRSRTFAYAVVDVGVAYRENVDEVLECMRRVAEEMRETGDLGPKILEPVEIVGVDRWADSAVTLRCRFKVAPLQQWTVRREYLRRLKHAFDAQGIEIPYPHLTLYPGQDKRGSAPPLRILNAGERGNSG
jgi:small conductance mechanosensitive channel